MTPIRVFISSVQREFAAERAALRDYPRGDPRPAGRTRLIYVKGVADASRLPKMQALVGRQAGPRTR